jgi:hypothetical protein
VTKVAARIVAEAAERTGQTLAQPAETITRYSLAEFDGLVMQPLSLPDEEAEQICLRSLVSAALALPDGRLGPRGSRQGGLTARPVSAQGRPERRRGDGPEA